MKEVKKNVYFSGPDSSDLRFDEDEIREEWRKQPAELVRVEQNKAAKLCVRAAFAIGDGKVHLGMNGGELPNVYPSKRAERFDKSDVTMQFFYNRWVAIAEAIKLGIKIDLSQFSEPDLFGLLGGARRAARLAMESPHSLISVGDTARWIRNSTLAECLVVARSRIKTQK